MLTEMFLAVFVLVTLLEVASFFHSNGRVKSLLNELIGTPNTHAYIHTHTYSDRAQSKDIGSDNYDVYCVSAPLSKLVEINIFVLNTQFYSRYFFMYNS